jgi:hypothetical protein
MKNRLTREERRVQDLAQRETFISERLTAMHGELSLLMRNLDRLVLPRSQRRRSTRKSYVDSAGNVVVFRKGGQ